MKMLLVLSFDVPTPEDIVPILKKINPPNLPHFANEVRAVIEPAASTVIEWLDEDEDKEGEGQE